MAGQVSPGIVLRERDLTTSTIVNTQSNTAAFVGSFEKGPVGTITSIATEKELLDTFGKPNNNNYEDWFVAQTFLNYGGQLQVARINDENLKNAVNNSGSSSSYWRLYVQDNGEFPSSGLVKIDNEFLFYGWKNTQTDPTYPIPVGTEYLGVSPNSGRGRLGTIATTHLTGATVTLWNYEDSVTDTTIIESVDATETIFDLDSSAGFAANDYARIVDLVDGDTEIVKIISVESGDQVVVLRAQLGTTALTGGTGYTFTKLVFSATADTTTLVFDYPRVSGSTPPLILSSSDFETNFGSYDFLFASKTAGTWSNNYKVSYATGDLSVGTYNSLNVGNGTLWSSLALRPGNDTDVHFAIIDDAGNIVETFLYLSIIEGATDEQGASIYYKDVLNRRSSFVYAGPETIVDTDDVLTLGGGADAYTTNVSAIEAAYDLFADVEAINIDFVICGGSLANQASQVSKAQKAISIASTRKDCIAFVSPHKGFIGLSSTSNQRDDIIDFFDAVGSSTSYAVFDSGYKYVYDRFNDTYRYIPCCGDVAGLCVEVSATSEDWFSPAGTNRGNLKSVVKLAYIPTKGDRDKLYQKRINPIASFPGQGVVLFGDKTALATPSAFDRINVRRLFLAVERRVNQLAKNVLFELNDAATRSYFANAVNSYLAEVQAKRGVLEYLVVCDETNNTSDVIDRNEFVAELYLKPSRSINYITITFVATRSGVSFSEIVGR
jgi:hypothetical protein